MYRIMIIAAALLMVIAAPLAEAQQMGGQRPGAGMGMRGQGRALPTEEDIIERAAKLSEELQLTADQEEQIVDLQLYHIQDMKDLRDDETIDRGDKFQKVQELRAQLDADILVLLNDEQKEKYKEIVEKQRSQRQDMMQGRGPNGLRGNR